MLQPFLIRRSAEENPDWGAPKIHGELQRLGFVVSEPTVARYLQRIRRRGDPGRRWLAFLQNHREVIVAFDFFTVPTLTFQLLYCFFVIEHGRRRILHFNVTRNPTDYVSYYHQDRIHDSLEKDAPNRRPVEHQPSPGAVVISNARVGGLHHRYSWRAAA